MLRALEGVPEVRAGDALHDLIAAAAPDDLEAGDVLVVAHKVVSKAEGRIRRLDEIEPSDRALELAGSDAARGKDPRVVQAILDESELILRSGHGVIVCATRHGFVCANAGVDQSNTSEPGRADPPPRGPRPVGPGAARRHRRRARREPRRDRGGLLRTRLAAGPG